MAVAVVVLAATDMLHFAAGYQPMGPSRGVFPPRTPVISYLERHRDSGRFVGLMDALLNDWGAIYGLRDVRGYDPPQPSGRFMRLWRLVAPEQKSWAPFEVANVDGRGQQVLSVLGARYWVAAAGTGVAPELQTDLKVGYSGRDATVLVDMKAVPRVFAAADIRVTGEEGESLSAIAESSFDPRYDAVIEDRRGLTAGLGTSGNGPAGTVRVTSEANSTVALSANTGGWPSDCPAPAVQPCGPSRDGHCSASCARTPTVRWRQPARRSRARSSMALS
jgi:hypothetical protein